MNYAKDPWYEERRSKVLQAVSAGKPKKGMKEKRTSPLGKYSLELIPYAVSDRRFPYYCIVDIQDSTGERIGKVIRNEADFPYHFIEGHKDGKDYLFCAEDYQGMTVINLTDGIKMDYISEKSKREMSLRITDFYVSPNQEILALEGHIKAKPNDAFSLDEIHFYDIKDLKGVPYQEIDKRLTFAYDKVIGWETNERFIVSTIEDYIMPSGICLDDVKDTVERLDHLSKGNIKKQTAYYAYWPKTGIMEKVFSEWR